MQRGGGARTGLALAQVDDLGRLDAGGQAGVVAGRDGRDAVRQALRVVHLFFFFLFFLL